MIPNSQHECQHHKNNGNNVLIYIRTTKNVVPALLNQRTVLDGFVGHLVRKRALRRWTRTSDRSVTFHRCIDDMILHV